MNSSVNSGRTETPGHINSPGVQHSSTAEIASQQIQEYIFHPDSPSLFHSTYFISWFIGIIALHYCLVNRPFEVLCLIGILTINPLF